MKLLSPSEISLRLNAPWSHHTLPRSDILVDGRETGQSVAGEVLKAAIEWESYCLLLVTDNIPFEDSLRMVLFDAQWKMVDCATLEHVSATGGFSNLTLVRPNYLCFQFTDGATWTLELLPRGTVSLPFFDPKGVSRPFSFFKRLRLHGVLLPHTSAATAGRSRAGAW